MPVPTNINDLSTTAASNQPPGGETPTEGDNYLRQYAAFIAALRDQLNGTANTGTVKAATFSGTHTFNSGNLLPGTYTPTGTTELNLSAVMPSAALYLRLGDIVIVFGRVTATPSAVGPCAFRLSLPVATASLTSDEVAGALSGATVSGWVYANIVHNEAGMQWTAPSTSIQSFSYIYGYRI